MNVHGLEVHVEVEVQAHDNNISEIKIDQKTNVGEASEVVARESEGHFQ